MCRYPLDLLTPTLTLTLNAQSTDEEKLTIREREREREREGERKLHGAIEVRSIDVPFNVAIAATVRCGRIVKAKGEWLELEVRLEIDLEIGLVIRLVLGLMIGLEIGHRKMWTDRKG
jgi:hypothetical protein